MQLSGEQRALDVWPGSPDELEELRLAVRDRLRAHPTVGDVEVTHVRPWLWSQETSGGRALTEAGGVRGYELRLSRYQHTPGRWTARGA